jgi:hypothetical protein
MLPPVSLVESSKSHGVDTAADCKTCSGINIIPKLKHLDEPEATVHESPNYSPGYYCGHPTLQGYAPIIRSSTLRCIKWTTHRFAPGLSSTTVAMKQSSQEPLRTLSHSQPASTSCWTSCTISRRAHIGRLRRSLSSTGGHCFPT